MKSRVESERFIKPKETKTAKELLWNKLKHLTIVKFYYLSLVEKIKVFWKEKIQVSERATRRLE